MSRERPTLAEVLDAHATYDVLYEPWRFRCRCGETFAVRESPQRWHEQHVADAAREHILMLLADKALVERCAEALLADLEASVREDVRAVLAQVAEAVRRG